MNPKQKLCYCSKPAVKKVFGSLWSCQDCIDKDEIVHELHRVETDRENLMDGDHWRESKERRKQQQLEYYYRKKRKEQSK